MTRPSEPLVSRLRQIVSTRNDSFADVARRAGMDSDRLSAILSPGGDMTVDELILLSQALALEPHDLGLELDDEGTPVPAVESLPYEAPSGFLDDDSMVLHDSLDAEGNHIRQLFEVGFGLGCTFFFQAKTNQLQTSGVPRGVLDRYADRELPIQLDAAYHAYNEPVYTAHDVTLKLSFDAIYTCTFPWSAITRMAFFPEPPPEPEPEEVEDDEPPESGRPPFLRLVE